MIIFDYSTLADDSHRRHFIEKPWDECNKCYTLLKNGSQYPEGCKCGRNPFTWEENYAAYYAAAKDDKPLEATINIYQKLRDPDPLPYELWIDIPKKYEEQNRSFLVSNWLEKHIPGGFYRIRMRPDGDTTTWHELKEKWFQELSGPLRQRDPEMAFERSGSPMIEIWEKYGVPVMEIHL